MSFVISHGYKMAAHLYVSSRTPMSETRRENVPYSSSFNEVLLLWGPSGLAPLSLEPELHHMAVPKQVSGWGKDIMADWSKTRCVAWRRAGLLPEC